MKIWIKGGLITIIVFLFAFSFLSILPFLSAKSEGMTIITSTIFFFGENPNFPLEFFGFAIIYFLVGAGIGLIVERLKQRKMD